MLCTLIPMSGVYRRIRTYTIVSHIQFNHWLFKEITIIFLTVKSLCDPCSVGLCSHAAKQYCYCYYLHYYYYYFHFHYYYHYGFFSRYNHYHLFYSQVALRFVSVGHSIYATCIRRNFKCVGTVRIHTYITVQYKQTNNFLSRCMYVCMCCRLDSGVQQRQSLWAGRCAFV